MEDVATASVTELAPLHWWKDFWSFQPAIFSALKRCPFIMVYILASSGLSAVTDQFDKFMRLSDSITFLALSCTIVFEVWSQLNNQPRQDHKLDYTRIVSAWGNSIFFGLAVLVGLLLLILPGIYTMTVGSLGIVFVCIEQKRAAPAFDASWKLVKGHFFQSARYLASAALLMALLICVGYLSPILMADEAFETTVASKVLTFVALLAAQWVAFSIVPLQVRLYAHLKRQEDSA